MTLSAAAATWFDKRGISPDVVARMAIYSGKRATNGDDAATVAPDPSGDILVFPFLERGEEVAAKYRARQRPDGSKVLWQRPGGKRTFYNVDILDDPALVDGSAALVITEGEPDALAVMTAGYPFVVSVPDGAPPDKDAHGNVLPPVPKHGDDIDPDHDDKYKFIFNNWDRLKKIKRFVLMTDGDGPGNRLRDELARRLGRVRCAFVVYPAGCKDANEVLLQHGSDAVMRMIQGAVLFPVDGIYRMSEFPDPPQIEPKTTGFRRLDFPVEDPNPALMLDLGLFMTVLGNPGSGKSTWTSQLAGYAAKIHGWNVGIATFDMRIKPQMQKLLRQTFHDKPVSQMTPREVAAADDFIDRRFTFINADSVDDEATPTIDWVLERAHDTLIRNGLDVLVLDPWNEVEHVRGRGESLTEYTGAAIRKLKRFARMYNVLVIVVIHPTKEGALKENLSLYDAADSAHWVNKADYGLIFERDYANGISTCAINKIRYRPLGRRGQIQFAYIEEMELFSQ
jgi:twinkle protein